MSFRNRKPEQLLELHFGRLVYTVLGTAGQRPDGG